MLSFYQCIFKIIQMFTSVQVCFSYVLKWKVYLQSYSPYLEDFLWGKKQELIGEIKEIYCFYIWQSFCLGAYKIYCYFSFTLHE